MPKKLFIIGNGFDIQHKISSKYEDFHKFIKNCYFLHKDPFYIPSGGLVPKAFSVNGYQAHDMPYVLAYIDYTITLTEGDCWYNLETSFANLKLIEEFGVDSDNFFTKVYSNDPPENTIYYIGLCFKILYKLFNIWVDQIDINNIKPNTSFQKLINPNEDYFLTFNYTRTLEEIYNAKNVFHIHGVQGSKKAFGHQKQYDDYIENFCKQNLIPLSCLEGVKYLFEITEKDTRKIYENSKKYFDSLDQNIQEIYSYGFSFSLVDMIYIFGICHSLNTTNITWYLSDFSSIDQIEQYKKNITNCGFKGSFATFHIENDKVNNIINNNKLQKRGFINLMYKISYNIFSYIFQKLHKK